MRLLIVLLIRLSNLLHATQQIFQLIDKVANAVRPLFFCTTAISVLTCPEAPFYWIRMLACPVPLCHSTCLPACLSLWTLCCFSGLLTLVKVKALQVSVFSSDNRSKTWWDFRNEQMSDLTFTAPNILSRLCKLPVQSLQIHLESKTGTVF